MPPRNKPYPSLSAFHPQTHSHTDDKTVLPTPRLPKG
jgi:hypothetical protein